MKQVKEDLKEEQEEKAKKNELLFKEKKKATDFKRDFEYMKTKYYQADETAKALK